MGAIYGNEFIFILKHLIKLFLLKINSVTNLQKKILAFQL
jgi:hypothetical protein